MNKKQSIIQGIILLGIVILINVIASFFYGTIDLTEDKRYTLTEATKSSLESLEDIIYVRVLMDGDFVAGFKRLQTSTEEMLQDFQSVSPYIEYDFIDPLIGNNEEKNKTIEQLAEQGLTPTNLRVPDGDKVTEKLIYPYAIFNYHKTSFVVNLLEPDVPGTNKDIILNNSVSLLEYKFANAIQKLLLGIKKDIIFTDGHGELNPQQTSDLESSLRPFYNTGRIDLDTVSGITQDLDLLVVAKPKTAFSDKDKFKIDQYVMNGGKVLWMLDKLNTSLDSISLSGNYIPLDLPLELDELLFKYGARIESNMVLDLECSRIPMFIDANQQEMFPWYYHPLIAPTSQHPIVKNLDRINLKFPSTIDTLKTKTNVKKTVLLSSSPYTRVQRVPARLNFEILRYEPEVDLFNKGPQPVALLLEGTFPSLYENRLESSMQEMLQKIGAPFKEKSVDTRMIVVSDGDFAKSLYNTNSQEVSEIGFNKWERRVYKGNKDFIINAIEYLIDNNGILNARSKEVKLRMLDKYRAKAERTKWQIVNIILPLVFLLLFGLVFNALRKRKYTS